MVKAVSVRAEGDAAFQRVSLADQVADAVLALISDADLQPGSPLPSTGALAERFNVSRSVVREALAELAGRGIVDRSQGKEATVAVPAAVHLEHLLSYRWDRGHLSPHAVMELRCCIEVEAARLAAARLDVKGAAEMDKAYAVLVAADAASDRLEADIGFHRAVAFASGNELLALILDAVSPLLRQARQSAHLARRTGGGESSDVVAEHRKLLDAILGGDPDAAGQAMSDHLERTLTELRPARTK